MSFWILFSSIPEIEDGEQSYILFTFKFLRSSIYWTKWKFFAVIYHNKANLIGMFNFCPTGLVTKNRKI